MIEIKKSLDKTEETGKIDLFILDNLTTLRNFLNTIKSKWLDIENSDRFYFYQAEGTFGRLRKPKQDNKEIKKNLQKVKQMSNELRNEYQRKYQKKEVAKERIQKSIKINLN